MTKAFTLAELLIVFGMVAVVATATTVISIQGNVQRSNDTKRKEDLQLIRSALEVYRSKSPTGEYPPASCYSQLISYLSPYIQSLPTDPKAGQGYNYQFQLVNGKYTKYLLCAAMENSGDANNNCGLACSPTGLGCNYGVVSP